MNKVLVLLVLCTYNLALVAGTAWLVVEYQWSAWWFALTLCLIGSYGKDDDKDGKGSE